MNSESANPNAGQVEAIFHAALAFAGAERAAYLAGACGTDEQFRQRVEALLRAHDQAEGFLPEEPAISARPKFVVPPSGGPSAQPAEAGTTNPPTAAPAVPVSEQPGDRIGRYTLREKIGEGGCGIVYGQGELDGVVRIEGSSDREVGKAHQGSRSGVVRCAAPPMAPAGLPRIVLSSIMGQARFSDMKFRLVVEFDRRAQRWSAVFPELPGCASAGDSEAEAVENAREALALWFEPSELKLKKKAKLLELSLP